MNLFVRFEYKWGCRVPHILTAIYNLAKVLQNHTHLGPNNAKYTEQKII